VILAFNLLIPEVDRCTPLSYGLALVPMCTEVGLFIFKILRSQVW